MSEKRKIGIAGASGYGGGELLRLLLGHPYVEVTLATAHRQAGQRVDAIHPHLRGLYDLTCVETAVTDAWGALDLLFLALPHKESPRVAAELPSSLRVVDLAGDFRLRDPQQYARFYGGEHPAFDLQKDFVYGLTELQRDAVGKAHRIANPGCFATATLLGLGPAVQAGLVQGKIIVDAKTGSSGSGANATAGTHHPTRDASFLAYKAFAHQHVPEIKQLLFDLNPQWEGGLVFQTHSAPMVRGIFASCYITLQKPMSMQEVRSVYAEAYAGSPFIRLVEGSPNVLWVRGSNFVDIGFALEDDQLIVFVAIDNLVKGAAGQAIQNMNLMMGWPEETGLLSPGACP
ncbi:MAG: N-acetyl-gamma-glutamyl-phosphate reductase [Myxococcales bacterium]|nr:N-acetyl-gamma-glutamyl-phosphate reductase [Myxococcales bacterium]